MKDLKETGSEQLSYEMFWPDSPKEAFEQSCK